MSQVVRDANVYFLPATPAPVAAPPAPSVWVRLRARCRAERWRVRFALRTPSYSNRHTSSFAPNIRAGLQSISRERVF